MRKPLKVIPLVFLICFAVAYQKEDIKNTNPLIGVWKVVELATIDSEGELKNRYEHPSIYIFQDDYYSMVMV